ncbi:hypothetical protein ACFPK9_13580 [Rubritalea spongiae]|uniref:Uncharacterized protein n=1 Tax=Rubritalea spongiae TaxID=430797 RepID=A0ABW5E503_9BACT
MKTTLSDSKLLLTQAAHASPSFKKRKGSFLIEASVSLFILVAIAIVLANASLNILQPRSWVMKQNLADAYLSKEVAAANKMDFDSIAAGTSLWGNGGLTNAQAVTLGQLPSFVSGGAGRAYGGEVRRERITLQGNIRAAAGLFDPNAGGRLALNRMGIRAYQLVSHVTYEIDGRTFVKSRTIVRSE